MTEGDAPPPDNGLARLEQLRTVYNRDWQITLVDHGRVWKAARWDRTLPVLHAGSPEELSEAIRHAGG